MPRAYSDALRRRILKAHDGGEGTLEELAKRFRVSLGFAKKISAARKKTLQVERVPRKGRLFWLVPEVKRILMREPELSLSQLQRRLEDVAWRVSRTWLWLTLNKEGIRLKRSHSRVKRKVVKGAERAVRVGPLPHAKDELKAELSAIGYRWVWRVKDPDFYPRILELKAAYAEIGLKKWEVGDDFHPVATLVCTGKGVQSRRKTVAFREVLGDGSLGYQRSFFVNRSLSRGIDVGGVYKIPTDLTDQWTIYPSEKRAVGFWQNAKQVAVWKQ